MKKKNIVCPSTTHVVLITLIPFRQARGLALAVVFSNLLTFVGREKDKNMAPSIPENYEDSNVFNTC